MTFATGHDLSGALTGLDWDRLAKGTDVLVLYMAGRQLGTIAARLIAAGVPADVAAVRSEDFDVLDAEERDIDESLDLVAIAVRP